MKMVAENIMNLLETFDFSDGFFFVAILVLIIFLVYIVYLVRVEDNDKLWATEKINTKKIKEEIKEDIEKKKR